MASTESELAFEKIKEILKKHGIKNVTKETDFKSLGIGGLEIDLFFEDYAKTFDVDMNGYNYYNFFFETMHPFRIISDWYYKIFNPEKVRKKTLTLDHLVKVAEVGKWFDPE